MTTRRHFLIASVPLLLSANALAAGDSFQNFLAGLHAEARRAGISQATLDRAFAGVSPNPKVLERDRRQPEFTMTWARYRAMLITDKRISEGREAVGRNRALLGQVEAHLAVAPSVVTGIWGLESSYGQHTGDFHVVEALSTLAWDGRRASFFRSELMAALKILQNGDVAPAAGTGSYAGAMGQPQFMPSSYLRYAVDFEGNGKRDIWASKADVFGSIANYLARSGWRANEAWGQPVSLPPGFDPGQIGRDNKRPLSEWAAANVRPLDGRWAMPASAQSAIVAPDGPGGEAFITYGNFNAIRRYNPSDFYALTVGLLGDRLLA